MNKLIANDNTSGQADISTVETYTKKLNREPQIILAIDQLSKYPTAKFCKTAETKEVINFLTNHFNLYGIPERIQSDKFISSEHKEFCKSRKIEIQNCPPRKHTGNGTVENMANMEDGNNLTESMS